VTVLSCLAAIALLGAVACGGGEQAVTVRASDDGLSVIGTAGDTTTIHLLNDGGSDIEVQVVPLGGRSIGELKDATSLPSWAKPVASIKAAAGKAATAEAHTDQRGGYALYATGGSEPHVALLSREKVESPAVVGGGSAGGGGAATPEPLPTLPAAGPVGSNSATINVSLKEFSVTPQPASTGSGQITFNVKNDGAVLHELVVIRTEGDPAKLPQSQGKVDETNPGIEVKGKAQNIAGGASGIVSATGLPAGKYALICNIPGHYTGGMHAAFTVQ
jgi:uncharacterized cupredoxin-like copper-binding protein